MPERALDITFPLPVNLKKYVFSFQCALVPLRFSQVRLSKTSSLKQSRLISIKAQTLHKPEDMKGSGGIGGMFRFQLAG